MARAWVKAVPPGIHKAPQGDVDATPERIRRWHRKHQEMKRLGLRVPVPWGHDPDALPGASLATASRNNAGYCEDSRVGADGALEFLVNVPGAEVDGEGHLLTEVGLPNGSRVRTAIKEVSAAIRDWTDGQRRLWRDAVTHVGLVVRPVVPGQAGFVPAELATAGYPLAGRPALYLSMSTLGERTMADETAVVDEPTPAEIASDEAGKGKQDEKMQRILSNLARLDYPLPEDTDAENFLDRLDVALVMAVHQKETDEADAAAQKTQADAGGGAPVTEESRPVMMSTLSKDLSPRERRMLEKQQADHRNALAGRIDKLVKLGLPVEKAGKLKARLTTYTLAVDESLAAVPQVVDDVVEYLEGALKALPPDRKTLSTLTEQANPAAAAAEADKMDPEEIAARADRVSRHQGESRWDRMKNGRK